jgi:peptidylprolyl isomerase
MANKILVCSFVFCAFVFLSGCAKPSGDVSRDTKSMTDPIEHMEKEIATLETAKSNINNAVNMQNQKLNQALDETGMSDATVYKEATLHTNKGDITLELYSDRMPITVKNFTKLAQEGFYNGVKFHRVIEGFMIQAGDPLSKDDSLKARWGTGGPGYTIKDEFYTGLSNTRGTIAMANAGPDTGGSQWFINLVDNTSLDPKHPVFGAVSKGMEVVDAIGNTDTEDPDRPVNDVVIEKITLIEK